MRKNGRNSREYRIFRIRVIRRDKVCQCCSSRKNRHVHHINNYKFFPSLRYKESNGICLCRTCHLTLFHGYFMNGTRNMTTKKHLTRFLKLYKRILKEKK